MVDCPDLLCLSDLAELGLFTFWAGKLEKLLASDPALIVRLLNTKFIRLGPPPLLLMTSHGPG